MWRSYLRIFLIGAILSSSGSHLAVVQSIAWTHMAITFLRHDNLSTSLQKTFDGNHPCELCRKIKQATGSGPSLTSRVSTSDHDGAFMSTPFLPAPNRTNNFLIAIAAIHQDDQRLPATPPPRPFLA